MSHNSLQEGLNPALESIDYGRLKKDGSHDHRTNKGNDRTPNQKLGDKKRSKSE